MIELFLNEVIRQRKKQGETQSHLANILNTNNTTYNLIENGKQPLTAVQMLVLAKHYKIDLSAMYNLYLHKDKELIETQKELIQTQKILIETLRK